MTPYRHIPELPRDLQLALLRIVGAVSLIVVEILCLLASRAFLPLNYYASVILGYVDRLSVKLAASEIRRGHPICTWSAPKAVPYVLSDKTGE